MKRIFITISKLITPLVFLTMASSFAAPPIGQPLVREGDLANKLVPALNMGIANSESEAENILGNAGIAPRNGWIADYPVTPDIAAEIRQSVNEAVDSKRLSMGKDEALKKFDEVISSLDLNVRASETASAPGNSTASTPETTVINNYYSNQGPPVVTYYNPPPDYVYLYTWVPYPFWSVGVWFPGYFILVDFHRPIFIHHRVEVISNHFSDHVYNRVVRIDPVGRFHGHTYGGIGIPHRGGVVSPGIRRGNEVILRGSHERAMTSGSRWGGGSGAGFHGYSGHSNGHGGGHR